MGRIADAIAQYRKALKLEDNNRETFAKLYLDDSKYIVNKLGISNSDYALVLDASLKTT